MVNFPLFTRVICLKKSARRTVYNLKKADLLCLKSAMRCLSSDTVFVDNDIDASTACWYDMFLSCVDEFFPKVLIMDVNRPTWIDREVLQLIGKKNQIRRKAKSKDSVFLWSRFLRLKQLVEKTVKFQKRNHLCNLNAFLKDNPRKFGSY